MARLKKEDQVRHLAQGEGDGEDGAGGDGPRGGRVESLPPNHDPPQLAAVEVRHRRDVVLVAHEGGGGRIRRG